MDYRARHLEQNLKQALSEISSEVLFALVFDLEFAIANDDFHTIEQLLECIVDFNEDEPYVVSFVLNIVNYYIEIYYGDVLSAK